MKTNDMLGKTAFVLGNIACAEGALAAGCKFFAAYPITPASEIGEHFVRKAFEYGAVFMQTEDEIAALSAVIGASWGGLKSMTATSGPGISLMSENIGLAVSVETPCVIVNVQRGAPSTGSPSLPLQGDMLQAKFGSHGDYEIIAFAPASPQEMFEHTILAFNASEQYRTPVFILSDALIGHMNEQVVFPAADEIVIKNRKILGNDSSEEDIFLNPDISAMPVFGRGLKANVTGSTHSEDGTRNVSSVRILDNEIRKLSEKIRNHIDEITMEERHYMDDAEVLFYSYGSISRGVLAGVELARSHGIRAGCCRAVTVWPFHEKRVAEMSKNRKAVIVCENNMRQIFWHVAAAVGGSAPVRFLAPDMLGALIQPEKVLEAAMEAIIQ